MRGCQSWSDPLTNPYQILILGLGSGWGQAKYLTQRRNPKSTPIYYPNPTCEFIIWVDHISNLINKRLLKGLVKKKKTLEKYELLAYTFPHLSNEGTKRCEQTPLPTYHPSPKHRNNLFLAIIFSWHDLGPFIQELPQPQLKTRPSP